MRDTFLQTPLWQQIVVTGEDGDLKSVFDLANVHADIFQVITGDEGILTLREFVSSWEKRNCEKHLTKWIDRNVPSCRGRRVEGSRLKLACKAGFDRIQNDVTSPRKEVLLVPRKRIGRTNFPLERKRSWKNRSTVCTILCWTTQSSHVFFSQIVSGQNSDVGKCRSRPPAK